MRRAIADGCLSVKVIHGKGGRDDSPAYILRERVHKFLQGHNLVVSYVTCRSNFHRHQPGRDDSRIKSPVAQAIRALKSLAIIPLTV